MPHFSPDTPRKPQKLFDLAITAPHPFVAGHVLTDPEAVFVNHQAAARVANQYAGRIRKTVEDALKAWESGGKRGRKPTQENVTEDWDHQANFDELYSEYELGAPRRGAGSEAEGATPLERMVAFLANEKAKANILAKGHSVAQFQRTKAPGTDQSMFKALVARIKDAYGEELTAQAQAQLDAQSSEPEADTDNLFEGLELPPEAASEAA